MLGWLKWGSAGVLVPKLDTLEDVIKVVRQLARFSQAAAEMLTDVSKLELMLGRPLTVTLDASSLPNYFPHGLARPFKGVIVVGQTQTPGPVMAWAPETVTANGGIGQSSATHFMLRCASATSFNVNVWVY